MCYVYNIYYVCGLFQNTKIKIFSFYIINNNKNLRENTTFELLIFQLGNKKKNVLIIIWK